MGWNDAVPDDENGDVIRSMAADGVDLSSPRIVDFEHVFSSEPFASEFASAVDHLVDKVVRFEPEPDGDGKPLWNVQSHHRMIPTHENISRLGQLLGQKAADSSATRANRVLRALGCAWDNRTTVASNSTRFEELGIWMVSRGRGTTVRIGPIRGFMLTHRV